MIPTGITLPQREALDCARLANARAPAIPIACPSLARRPASVPYPSGARGGAGPRAGRGPHATEMKAPTCRFHGFHPGLTRLGAMLVDRSPTSVGQAKELRDAPQPSSVLEVAHLGQLRRCRQATRQRPDTPAPTPAAPPTTPRKPPQLGYAAAVSTASVGSSSSAAIRANVALSRPSRPRRR
jgi:hypothetical protein